MSMEPYVFAHRGASGYEVENTISSFETAVKMGAGIEADLRFTKNKRVICFHDPFFKVGDQHYIIQNLTYHEIQAIKFEDHRKVPTLEDVFETFNTVTHNLRYSFDIADKEVGLELLNIARKLKVLDRIEITDRRINVLSQLRKQNQNVKLIYTIAENVNKISDKSLILKKLNNINVYTINLRIRQNVEELFKQIIDNNLECYIWGVNSKTNMKKILKLKYKNFFVNAIYTDYPDKLIDLIKEEFS